ncbi:hypothetical protein [Sphingomonas sp. BK235]|uniref:hypothetical protein n=1 Tax=Sphingomonas sp. BK235 TaxID=2512131 RepID=UPI00104BD118|nr:hypothetical protein [Sphingomonas sp. BK235]TCP33137.1 hypothetical protein EV292_10679 [Sphingomonas sp. BK235]
MVAAALPRPLPLARAGATGLSLSHVADLWERVQRRRDSVAVAPSPAPRVAPTERPLPRDLDLPLRLFDPAAMARGTGDSAPRPRPVPFEPLLLDETLQRLRVLVAA